MLSRSFFPNFGQGPFPEIAGKGPVLSSNFLVIFRVLELLLKNEARAGMTDNQGFNAIHYAALKGHRLALEMVCFKSLFKSFKSSR